MQWVRDEVVRLDLGERNYAFHVPTSSFYELDAASQAVLDAAGSSLTVDDAPGPLGEPAEVAEIVQDLAALRLLIPEGARSLRGGAQERPAEGGIANLVMHVAHTCNLACGYCYAEQGLYKGKAELMTEARAREYVEWLFAQADPSAKQIGLTFFGGEPLLNFPVVKAAAAHAQDVAARAGKSVKFGITTNGTLVTEEIAAFLESIQCTVTVSLDAIGKSNDRLRPFHSGRGSYDRVMERIAPLLSRKIAVARVTVTRQNLDVVHTVETLLAAGFREVGCSPVDAKNAAYDLEGSHYDELLRGFKELSRRWVDAAKENRTYGFSNIANIVKAVHSGHNKDYPCGAGVKMVAGAPDGTMSLCHRFVGEKDWSLGSLQTGGLDAEKRKKTLEVISLEQRTDCANCWARYICSGGCHHVNFLFRGHPSRTYTTHCDWLRAWYRTGLEAYADVLHHNPAFITRFVDPGYTCRQ
jgi:uncharacterized protein